MAGHVGPMSGLIAELVRRGHPTRVHTGARYRDRFARLGADVIGWSNARDFDEERPEATFPRVRGSSLRRSMTLVQDAFLGTAAGQVADLAAALDEEPADVLIGEVFTLGPGLVAEQRGLPWASVNALPPNVLSQELPPPGMNVAPARGPIGRHRDVGLRRGFEILTAGLHHRYDRIRADLRLNRSPGPFGSAFYSPWLSLLTGVPALEHARSDLPAAMHFVGRLPVSGRSGGFPTAAQGHRPLVLVTQGTHNTDPRDLLQPAVLGLAGLPIDVLATTGRTGVTDIGLPPPANACIVDFADFDTVLDRTAVLVANGGWGALLEALSAGIPMVVAGGDIDKPENARRVARARAGIDLRTGRPRPAAVAAAVEQVLADPSYRAAALAIAAELAALGGAGRAADLVEELAETRAPVLRRSDPWARL